MILWDLRGIVKRSIATVISVENPHEDYYIIKLKPKPRLKWTAGEHAIYTLPTKVINGKRWRAFSVASAPEEGYLMIGTRLGSEPSEFKQELTSMSEGELVAVCGPFGWFKVKGNAEPLVMIAGGVGITPIRALLKSLEYETKHKIEVVYASTGYYMFGEEIESIIAENAAMTLHKTRGHDNTNDKIDELIDKYGMEAKYYVSGPPKFIRAMRERLVGKGIKGSNIFNNPFSGY